MKLLTRAAQGSVLLLAVILALWAALSADAAPGAPQVVTRPGVGPPGIYVFYDWSKLSPQKYPIIGGEMVFHWDLIETGPQTYDWTPVEQWVAGLAAQGKLAGLRINAYDGQCCGGLAIPAHVMQAHPATTLTCAFGAKQVQVPRYWDPEYQRAYGELVRQFGARYNADPRVAWIEISVGIFGETGPAEDEVDACLQSAGLSSETWVDFVKWSVDAYRAAFPDTQLLLQYTSRFLNRWERREFSDYAAGLGVGLKHNGLKPDAGDDAYITDAQYSFYQAGQYDPLARWGEAVPTGFEGTAGAYLPDRASTLWGIYNALDKHADYLVLDTQLVTAADRLDILEFAAQYIGRRPADTPSVWAALRETEGTWAPDYGNYEFWLYQNDAVPGGKTQPSWKVGAAPEGRYARRTDQASGNASMYFDVDDDYAFGGNNAATITVTYYDRGFDRWELHYDSTSGSDKVGGVVTKQNTLTWRQAPFVLPDVQFANRLPGGGARPGSDFYIWSAGDGDDELIHFVDVQVRPGDPKLLALQPGVDSYDGLADTYLDQSTPAINHGSEQRVLIRSREAMAGLLRFDLAGLPANARIISATLEMYQYNRSNPALFTLTAHRMLRPWDEFAATWELATAQERWQQPGAGGLQDRDSVAAGAVTINQDSGPVALDVSLLVRQWAAVPASNYGLLLRGTSSSAVEYRFGASSYSVKARRPRLVIEYVEAAATRTPTPTHTATLAAPSPTATATPTAEIPAATSTATPTATLTAALPTYTPTPTTTATATAPPTQTPTTTATATAPPTQTPTTTAIATAPPTQTPTTTATATAPPTQTPTTTATATTMPTETLTVTAAPTLTETAVATFTPPPVPTPAGSIAGSVWLDLNRDGQRDPWEKGIAGMAVALHLDAATAGAFAADAPWRQTLSGIDGRFDFLNLPAGSYLLTLPQYVGLAPTTPIWVRVALDENILVENTYFGLAWYYSAVYLPLILQPR